MKILVTGCAGFIGVNFVNYWLDNHPNDKIIGVDCLTYASNKEVVKEWQNKNIISFYKANICSKKQIFAIFSIEKPDVVVNFAAQSHVDRSIKNPSSFITTNVLGVRVLLDACLKYNVKRFHQVSTDEVYGHVEYNGNEVFTEISHLNPRSPYSASKASADLLCLSYFTTYGLNVTISRCSNNYGPYQHEEKLIPKTIKNCLKGDFIPVYGNGENIRDWIYVLDHCRAIDYIINSNQFGQVFNISSGVQVKNIDLVKNIINLLGKNQELIKFVKDRKGHDEKYTISSAKINDILSFSCECDFDKYLLSTIKWYVNNYNNI